MKVRFIGLAPEAITHKSLTPATPVAHFEDEHGSEARVLAGQVNPFKDVDFSFWSGRVRETLLVALCEHVRRAEWFDARSRLLDLSRRFEITPDRDEPVWVLRGFTWIQNVDLHLIKHVLGVGGGGAEAVARWSNLLQIPIAREDILARLEKLNCVAWKRLAEDADPDFERPIALHAGLSRSARAECIRLLAPLRERYMELSCEVVRATGFIKHARHVHLGTEQNTVMHFLDDAGTTVIAKGECQALSVCTAFSALVTGESTLGPKTLKSRWIRIVNDTQAVSGGMKVHSPLAWGVLR
ncbi:hypothetical protein [Hyalangium gracile]|uniref:hypothetical protein n=1 Tax=Hyalangium gracile TaxID=394092 RepID=UPI001CCB9B45|nr:hypothetical protein [Hyalangium gracile]